MFTCYESVIGFAEVMLASTNILQFHALLSAGYAIAGYEQLGMESCMISAVY
jgi:hypothetical protein